MSCLCENLESRIPTTTKLYLQLIHGYVHVFGFRGSALSYFWFRVCFSYVVKKEVYQYKYGRRDFHFSY